MCTDFQLGEALVVTRTGTHMAWFAWLFEVLVSVCDASGRRKVTCPTIHVCWLCTLAGVAAWKKMTALARLVVDSLPSSVISGRVLHVFERSGKPKCHTMFKLSGPIGAAIVLKSDAPREVKDAIIAFLNVACDIRAKRVYRLVGWPPWPAAAWHAATLL